MYRWVVPAALIAAMSVSGGGTAQEAPAARANILPGGAQWAVAMPTTWNGTLLVYSRGYSPKAGTPEPGPAAQRQMLLDAGYAIVASDYGTGGWALAEAVPAQLEAITAFAAKYGKPKRVIAWGSSMGGLVTTALAERPRGEIDGAVAACASIGGALGMMNMALDGAYAFKTLVAPDSDIRVVGIDDDRINAGRVATALTRANGTPQGRARIALAGVLAGIPGWTSKDRPRPATDDYAGQTDEIARSFGMGVFLPRVDQEQRAGGVFSWNTGIDYRKQLAVSDRRPLVEAMYRAAGLNLEADLDRLNAGERIAANPKAVAYMRAHYTPNARPTVPLLAVQMIGDGLTSPSMQRAYVEASGGTRAKAYYVEGAGHCTIPGDAILASIRNVEARIQTGKWPTAPANFIAYTPPPMTRPCFRGKTCR